jgi:hypothetical protein
MRSTLLLALVSCLFAEAFASEIRNYGQDLPFYEQIDHPWSGVLGQPFPVRILLAPNGGRDFTCAGRLLVEDGTLLLSGGWDMVVEEIADGQVIASRSLKPTVQGEPGAMIISEASAQKPLTWDAKACFAHPGNYRLQLTYGGTGRTGELFRIDTTRDPPPWISLTVQPDQPRAMFGAPVQVDFIVANHGSDGFHVRFGGDYRGATRPLRFYFTAVRSDGVLAWDPEPEQNCMGGIGTANDLAPGKNEHQAVTLGAYLRFPSPGTYTVTAYHNLEFGTPVLAAKSGHGAYALAGTFTLTLEPPSPEGIAAVLAKALSPGSFNDSWALLAHLHEPFFLPALREALGTATDREQTLALVDGIDSIDTPAATRVLIDRIRDARPFVRQRALIRLRDRAPQPPAGRWPQQAESDRRHDARTAATWNDFMQQLLLDALPSALASDDPDAFGAAVDLASVAGGNGIGEAIAAAADRFAPALPVPEAHFTALNHLENGGYELGRLGQPPCRAGAGSSPGRLIVWAKMIEGSGIPASPASEELLLPMLTSACPPVRRAALAALNDAALARLPIPWQSLFMDENERDWSTPLHRSMAVPLAIMRPIIQACPKATWSERKKLEFERMLALRKEHEERP